MPTATSTPATTPHAATRPASPSTSRRTSPRRHAERSQRDVLPAALEHQAEHEDGDARRAHEHREHGIERHEALDVERREARLVLVQSGLGGVDVHRVLLVDAGPEGGDGAGQAGRAGLLRAGEEEVDLLEARGVRVGLLVHDDVDASGEAREVLELAGHLERLDLSVARCRGPAAPGPRRPSRCRGRRPPSCSPGRRSGPRPAPPSHRPPSGRRRTSPREPRPARTRRGRSPPDRLGPGRTSRSAPRSPAWPPRV